MSDETPPGIGTSMTRVEGNEDINKPYSPVLAEDGQQKSSDILHGVVGYKKRFAAEESLRDREVRLQDRENKLKISRKKLETEVRELNAWADELEEREARLQDMQNTMLSFEAEKSRWEEDKKIILEELRRMEEEIKNRELLLNEKKDRMDEFEEKIMEGMRTAEDVERRSVEAEEQKRRVDIREAKLLSMSRDAEEKSRELQERSVELRKREENADLLETRNRELMDENSKLSSRLDDMESKLQQMEEKNRIAREEAAQSSRLREALRRAEVERDNLRKNLGDRGRTKDMQIIHELRDELRALDIELQKKASAEKRHLEDLATLERRIRDMEREKLDVRGDEGRPLERETFPDYAGETVVKETYDQRSGAREEAVKMEEDMVDENEAVSTPDERIPVRRAGDAEVWYQKGLALMKKANFRPAVLCFDHVLEKRPRDADVLLQKARALYASNGNAQASRILEDLSGINQNNADVWELKAMNLYKLHHDIDALEAFEKTIELEKRPSAMKLAARILQKRNQHEKALIYINDALRMDPGDSQCWKMKASILTDMGRHQEAGEALRSSRIT